MNTIKPEQIIFLKTSGRRVKVAEVRGKGPVRYTGTILDAPGAGKIIVFTDNDIQETDPKVDYNHLPTFEQFSQKSSKRVLPIIFALLLASVQGLSAAGLTLSWTSPTKNIDGSTITALAGYRIYYGPTSNGYVHCLDAGASQKLSIVGLTPGIPYHFAITAYNSKGTESPLSSDITWTSPTNTMAVPFIIGINLDGSGVVSVSWTSVANQVFTLQKTYDLTVPFQDCISNILATPPCNTAYDVTTKGTNSAAFYRILVTY